MEITQKRTRLPWIEALRGYGCIGVIAVHLAQRLCGADIIEANAISNFMFNGARAVQLFYIISGMMIFASLDRKPVEDIREYWRYVLKRYRTIFPAYILVMLLYWLIGDGYAIVQRDTKIGIVGIVLNLLGLHGFSSTYCDSVVPGGWYIGVIWMYYLIAPLLHRCIKNASAAANSVLVFLGVRVLFHGICGRMITDPKLTEWADMFFLNHMAFIALGQFLYFVVLKKDVQLSGMAQFSLVICLLYAALQIDSLAIWAVAFAVLIVLCHKADKVLLVNKCALFLGSVSYEVFLVHNGVLYLLCLPKLSSGNMYADILLYLAVVVILSAVVGFGIKKGLGCLNRMLYRKQGSF